MPVSGKNALARAEDLGRLPEILIALPKYLIAPAVGLTDHLSLVWIAKKLGCFALVPRGERQVRGILNASTERAIAAAPFGFQTCPFDLLCKKRVGKKGRQTGDCNDTYHYVTPILLLGWRIIRALRDDIVP